MLMSHPAVLRNLVEQYEALRLLHAEEGSPGVRRRMHDIGHSLCVSTGARDAESALAAARHRLLEAEGAGPQVLGGCTVPGTRSARDRARPDHPGPAPLEAPPLSAAAVAGPRRP